MRRFVLQARALVGALVLMLPVVSAVMTQTAQASAPTLSYYGQVGQPNDNNVFPQAWQGVSGSGFNYPYSLKIDTVLHHLFVVDKGNHRVLVFNLDNSNELVDKTADYVIGQTDMTKTQGNNGTINPTAATLNEPRDLAIDETTHLLYVSDAYNARVMVYDTSNLSNGMSASHILGKVNMNIGVAPSETGAGTLVDPYGIAVDSTHHRLFVGNAPNRVSVFDITSVDDGEDAVNVLGQADFLATSTTEGCGENVSASNLCSLIGGIAYNATNQKLYVSDAYNHRMLEYDVAAITDGEAAVHILGQETMFVNSYGGSPTDKTLVDPRAISVDETGQKLFVSDAGYNSANRINIFDLDSGDVVDWQAASVELGQPDFTSYALNQNGGPNWAGFAAANTTALPYGVAFNSSTGKLFAADSDNHRVLVYKSGTHTNNEDAIDVLGQTSFNGWNSNGQSINDKGFMFNAVTEIDSVHHRLFEADYQNERVLVFNLNDQNELVDKTADHVLGAPNLFSLNWDKCDNPTISTLCFGEGIWGGLAYDAENDHLFVTGGMNNRILIFDTATIVDGEDAIGLIGQPDFDSNSGCDWDEGVSASTLCNPANLALDTVNHKLFAVDTANHRVLVYDLDENTNLPIDATADTVIGQQDFTSHSSNDQDTFQQGLNYPNGISLDNVNNRLYVADTGNSRIISYDLSLRNEAGEITGMISDEDMLDMAGDSVLGQSEPQYDNGCNRDGDASAETLCYPNGVSVDVANHRLYVADTNNNRVLGYQLSETSDYLNTFANMQSADLVVGQTSMTDTECNQGLQNMADSETLCQPWGVTVDSSAHMLYIADTSNNRVSIYRTASASSPNTPQSQNLVSEENGASIAFTESGCSGIDRLLSVKESSLTVADAAYNYPAGLVDFKLTGCSGGVATVNITVAGTYDLNKVALRKYNPNTKTYATIDRTNEDFSVVTTTLNNGPAIKVTYNINDGGPFDTDGAVDGNISDPIGFGQLVVSVPNTGLAR